MRFVALAIIAGSIGCIVFVNESTPNGDQFTTTCQLLDTTSSCGACIQDQCADLITACCTDSTCKPVLKQFDTCADAGTCTVDQSSSAAAALAQCVTSKCNTCSIAQTSSDGGGPTTTVNCSVNASLDYCFCDGDAPGSKIVSCTPTTIPDGICCGDIGYPNSGTCSCMMIKCESQTDGCMCSTSANGNQTTCNESLGDVCCADATDGFCTCSSDNQPGCDQFTTEVSDCKLPASIRCDTAQVWLTSCSL